MRTFSETQIYQKVAELLVVRASGFCSDHQRKYPQWELSNSKLQQLLSKGVGGVILFGGNAYELSKRCELIRSWSNKTLLICADIEEGLGQRFEGGTWLVPPMTMGQIYKEEPSLAIQYAMQYGQCIGEQSQKCGLNWVLAPVCDINNNFSNPVINMRAWGEDPITVSKLICAFHRGIESTGVLSCAKHFPGHGDTAVDSHLNLPILEHDFERLEEIEMIPFKAAITQGVNSVMTAHILLRQLDPNLPATFSKKVINNLLRKRLGFDGLVVSDALIMEAVSKAFDNSQAALMAFSAGVDLILMPQDADEAIEVISQALISGKIPIERLEESLLRRSKALDKFNKISKLKGKKKIDLKACEIEHVNHRRFSLSVISRSIKTRNHKLLQTCKNGINLLQVDNPLNCPYLSPTSPAIAIPNSIGYSPLLLHQLGISPWQDNLEEPLILSRLGKGPFLIQLFIRGYPFRGSNDFEQHWANALKQLQSKKLLAGLVVYGSHYVWDDLLKVLDDSIPAIYSPGQMDSAQNEVLSSWLKLSSAVNSSILQTSRTFTD